MTPQQEQALRLLRQYYNLINDLDKLRATYVEELLKQVEIIYPIETKQNPVELFFL
jgi:hypothetical protein